MQKDQILLYLLAIPCITTHTFILVDVTTEKIALDNIYCIALKFDSIIINWLIISEMGAIMISFHLVSFRLLQRLLWTCLDYFVTAHFRRR